MKLNDILIGLGVLLVAGFWSYNQWTQSQLNIRQTDNIQINIVTDTNHVTITETVYDTVTDEKMKACREIASKYQRMYEVSDSILNFNHKMQDQLIKYRDIMVEESEKSDTLTQKQIIAKCNKNYVLSFETWWDFIIWVSFIGFLNVVGQSLMERFFGDSKDK